MERISRYLKKLSEERGYYYFSCEKNGEIWISGYINEEKFDLVVKPYGKFKVKVIFETAKERKPALFLNKMDAYKRLKSIFENQQEAVEVG